MTVQEMAVMMVALSNSTALPPFNANAIAKSLLDEIATRPGELPHKTVVLLLGIAVALERHHAHTVAAAQQAAQGIAGRLMH